MLTQYSVGLFLGIFVETLVSSKCLCCPTSYLSDPLLFLQVSCIVVSLVGFPFILADECWAVCGLCTQRLFGTYVAMVASSKLYIHFRLRLLTIRTNLVLNSSLPLLGPKYAIGDAQRLLRSNLLSSLWLLLPLVPLTSSEEAHSPPPWSSTCSYLFW